MVKSFSVFWERFEGMGKGALMKYLNDSQLGKQQLNEIHSELDQIVRKSEALIAEFQRITQKTPQNNYSLLGLIRKKRNPKVYDNFRSVDNKLGDAVVRFARFRADNECYLSVPTRAYVEAYEEYLQSVKTAAELRVALEQQFMELDISTNSVEEVDHVKKLSGMIGPSLDDCEEKAHKVNEVINSFKR